MAEKRIRRTKKELLNGEIAKVDTKIAELEAKIETLEAKKEELEQALKAVEESEDKARQEAEQKEMLTLLKKKGVGLDSLKAMLSQSEE